LDDKVVAAGRGIAPFLGTWKGQWSNVTENGIRIQEVNGRPDVTIEGDEVWNERLENGRQTFCVRVGGSGREFTYAVEPVVDGLSLDVYRHRDGERFTGKLTK